MNDLREVPHEWRHVSSRKGWGDRCAAALFSGLLTGIGFCIAGLLWTVASSVWESWTQITTFLGRNGWEVGAIAVTLLWVWSVMYRFVARHLS